MRTKLRKTLLLFICCAMIFVFAACDSNLEEQAPGNTTDSENIAVIEDSEFSALINKHIIKVENEDPIADTIKTDVDWIEEQLKESIPCEAPSEVVALALWVDIYYEDGTMAVLNLLDPNKSLCGLTYNGESYCIKSDTITQWLLHIGEGTLDESGFAPEGDPASYETIPDDDFSILMNKTIRKIEFDPVSGEKAIDIDWLENQFSMCEQYSGDDVEKMALELELHIFYDDGTSSTLRLINEEWALLSIRYDGVSYRFRSEIIAMSILQ